MLVNVEGPLSHSGERRAPRLGVDGLHEDAPRGHAGEETRNVEGIEAGAHALQADREVHGRLLHALPRHGRDLREERALHAHQLVPLAHAMHVGLVVQGPHALHALGQDQRLHRLLPAAAHVVQPQVLDVAEEAGRRRLAQRGAVHVGELVAVQRLGDVHEDGEHARQLPRAHQHLAHQEGEEVPDRDEPLEPVGRHVARARLEPQLQV